MSDEELRAAERAWRSDPSAENEERYDRLLVRTTGWGLYPLHPKWPEGAKEPDPPEDSWHSRDQSDWFDAAFDSQVSAQEPDYQGSGLSIVSYKDRGREAWCVISWSFGSCSHCDFWQSGPSNEKAKDYVEGLMRSAVLRRWTLGEVLHELTFSDLSHIGYEFNKPRLLRDLLEAAK